MLGDNIRTQQTAYLMHVAYNFGMAEKYFTIDSLKKSYSDKMIFDSLSCSFHSNGLYLLLGENGSGKSTLLNILSGKDTDYEGKVSYSGEELTEKDRESFSDSCVSYVAQDSLVFEDRKAIDDFLLPYEKKDREKAKKILTDLGLGDVLEEKCKELSEGEKERLCFGQALYADKEIILLDEIMANLDPVSTERILKNILALSKGRLVIFATHDGMPDWFTKDAFILRRKDGKLSEEKEGMPNAMEVTLRKNRKHSVKYHFLSSFHTDTKYHWLLAAICTLFTMFSFWCISVSESIKVTQSLSENGTISEKYPFEDVCNQVFIQTAPILPTYEPLPDETIVYPVVHASWLRVNENTKTGGEDYKIPGKTFEGICIYQDNDPDKVKLTEGKYPTEQFECIIPDICQRNNPELRIGAKIKSREQQGTFTIVGIYKAKNADMIAKKYQDYDPRDYNMPTDPTIRIIYGFQTETIFCGKGNYKNTSRLFLIPNTSKNREAFLNSNPSQFFNIAIYSPICTDKKTGKWLFTREGFMSGQFQLEKTGKLFFYILPVFLILYILGYFAANRRKYILLRFLGTSRKKLLKDSLFGNLSSSFLGFALGIILGILSIVFRNLYYNSHFGTTGLVFFHPYYKVGIASLVTFASFAILFVLFSYFILLPKKRKKEEIKRK